MTVKRVGDSIVVVDNSIPELIKIAIRDITTISTENTLVRIHNRRTIYTSSNKHAKEVFEKIRDVLLEDNNPI